MPKTPRMNLEEAGIATVVARDGSIVLRTARPVFLKGRLVQAIDVHDLNAPTAVDWLARLLRGDQLIRLEQESGRDVERVHRRKPMTFGLADCQVNYSIEIVGPFQRGVHEKLV